jgi:hypothetical protein
VREPCRAAHADRVVDGRLDCARRQGEEVGGFGEVAGGEQQRAALELPGPYAPAILDRAGRHRALDDAGHEHAQPGAVAGDYGERQPRLEDPCRRFGRKVRRGIAQQQRAAGEPRRQQHLARQCRRLLARELAAIELEQDWRVRCQEVLRGERAAGPFIAQQRDRISGHRGLGGGEGGGERLWDRQRGPPFVAERRDANGRVRQRLARRGAEQMRGEHAGDAQSALDRVGQSDFAMDGFEKPQPAQAPIGSERPAARIVGAEPRQAPRQTLGEETARGVVVQIGVERQVFLVEDGGEGEEDRELLELVEADPRDHVRPRGVPAQIGHGAGEGGADLGVERAPAERVGAPAQQRIDLLVGHEQAGELLLRELVARAQPQHLAPQQQVERRERAGKRNGVEGAHRRSPCDSRTVTPEARR